MKKTAQQAQTAAERRAAEQQVRELVSKHAPAHRSLVTGIRKRLRTRLPTAYEIVYDYRDCVVISVSPSERGYEGVFAIRASQDEVKLYFQRGKDLSDPGELLQGSGSQARWILVENMATLSRKPVAALIDEAIARSAGAFETSRRGAVVIRAASPKGPAKPRPAKKTAKKVAEKKATRAKKKT